MTDDRERWALILGGSSGMGEATALALAKAGYNICGIHLDFRAALAHVDELKAELAGDGADVLYINMNAAEASGCRCRLGRDLRTSPHHRWRRNR